MAVSDKETTKLPSSTTNTNLPPKADTASATNSAVTPTVSVFNKLNETSVDNSCDNEKASKSENNVEENTSQSNLKQSEVDDIFKADCLQQLSTSALPRYTPGSPPRFIKHDTNIKTFDIHCCAACGDTFALKASLNFHLERRSVLIKFPCETCKSTRIFYNRCNLLSHIRGHTDKNEKADIEKAVVSVLPRVFMDGIQNEFVSTLDDELNTMEESDDPRPGEMVECSLMELDESMNEKPKKEENEISFAKVKCLDCNEEFESAKDRKEHLTNGDKIPVVAFQCNKCGLLCPSKCSLKAHQRIHLQISPYVCPECGESPDPHWVNFLHHVNFVCFHNSRGVGYKCPVCKRFSPSNDSLLKHMELHTETYAKCSECPRAYNSAHAFKQHYANFHNGKPVRYTMIYKCSLCDIVFVSSDQMLTHRATHLKEQVCDYVFNCMQCGKPSESKLQLLDHMKTDHPKIYKQNIQTEPTPTRPIISLANQYRGTVECLLCMATFYSQQGYCAHVSRAHINVDHPCSYCHKILPNRREMVKHGKMHLEEKAVLCLLCNNKKIPSLKELDQHLDDHVKKLKFCSFCPLCDRMFLSLQASLNHLRAEHNLPTKNEIQAPPTMSILASPVIDTICHFCRKAFGSNSELRLHLKQSHNIDEHSLDRSETFEPLKKQCIEGNSCAKCDFHSSNREEFKKHILSHKTNRSTFQCLECGLCFVVQPALIKHLRIIHKVSDTAKYITDEGTNYVPDLESAAEVSKRSALECEVCFTSFPNETALKTHMRSHGMAFIQANKSGLL